MFLSLSMDVDSFAARRRSMLERVEDALRPHVDLALIRVGLPGWFALLEQPVIEQFNTVVADEFGDWSQIIEDMRDAFMLEMSRSLAMARRDDNHEAQIERITRWVSTATVNAATEAVVAVDPDESVGLEWVSMADADVRHSHREAHGQIVPLGGTFEVEGYQVNYPGQPVGPPSIWLNCRCLARPAMLTDAAGTSATFAADDAPPTTAVIVALPAEDDPIHQVAHEDAHVTLAFFGEVNEETATSLVDSVTTYFEHGAPQGPIEEPVNGTATLGPDKADVVLIDAHSLVKVREALLEDPDIILASEAVEQYPTWIPHLTVGYPDTPRQSDDIPESITFDRIAVWNGENRTEFTLGEGRAETMPDSLAAAAATETEGDVETDSEAPEITDEDLYLPVPWHGVLAPEGTPSGDGRQFAPESLRHRDLPLPLKYMPADADGHDGSIVVGRIDRIWREDGKILGEGVFDHSPDAYEAVRQIAEQMIRGVSVDVDDATASMDEEDSELLEFSSARIAAATLCAIPAFAEAFVALGPWEDDPNYQPKSDPEADVQEQVDEEGYALVSRFAISEADWDGSPGRFSLEEYHRSCILHRHDGEPESKDDCSLPIREPNGDLNRNAVHAAAGRIDQTEGTEEQISAAKSALRSAYDELDEEAPESLTAAAEGDNAPGRLEDGSAPQCEYGEEEATQYVLHSEGKAFIPTCDEHLEQAQADAATSVPGEEPDETNIDRIGSYSFAPGVPGTPGTKDGPGWITHPRPTARIRRYWVRGEGALKIRWGQPGDFNRCRRQLVKYVQNPEWLAGLCANMHKEALGIWPGQHTGGTEKMTDRNSLTASVTLVDARETLSADWFRDPELTGPTPITVTEDGRIFGHIAVWGVCHIGIADECVEVPRSKTNYAYFLTGEVSTDAGPVAVGQISLGGGHARDGMGMRPTIAHYDSTSTAAADVTVGEDEFGVWVAGAARPNLSDEDFHALRASAPSGDWREVIVNGQSSLELVAALSVNVPGFPVPRPTLGAHNGRSVSLVAAGVPQAVAESRDSDFTAADLKAAVKDALAEMAEDEKRKAKAAHSKEVLRSLRARKARERLTSNTEGR